MSQNPNLKPIKAAIHFVEILGLVIIAIATIIAAGVEISQMIDKMHVNLSDLLMLFLYLEILAMVKVYLETGKLPIRFPLYIAIIALARYLIIDVKQLESIEMITIAGTILIIGVTLILVRYGHTKMPYPAKDEITDQSDLDAEGVKK